jgi:uncharacterized membrane protein
MAEDGAMAYLTRLFLRGLAAVLPLVLTFYIVYWLGSSSEQLFEKLIRLAGLQYTWPGMGIVMAVAITCLVGLLTYNRLVQWVYGLGTSIVERIPMVKTLYRMLSDVTGFFAHSEKRRFNKVVMVQPVDGGPKLVGFVTRENLTDLPPQFGGSDMGCVYMPLSYCFGGFLITVPKDRVQPVDMGMQDALRFVLTAGMGAETEEVEASPSGASS